MPNGNGRNISYGIITLKGLLPATPIATMWIQKLLRLFHLRSGDISL